MIERPNNLLNWSPPPSGVEEPSALDRSTGFLPDVKPKAFQHNYYYKSLTEWYNFINEALGCYVKPHNVIEEDYIILDDDGIGAVLVTTGLAERTITLPSAANNIGKKISIIKIDNSLGYITIEPSGLDTISNQVNTGIYDYGNGGVFISDGISNWELYKTLAIPSITDANRSLISNANNINKGFSFPNLTITDYKNILQVNQEGSGFEFNYKYLLQTLTPIDQLVTIDFSKGSIVVINSIGNYNIRFSNLDKIFNGRIVFIQDSISSSIVSLPYYIKWQEGIEKKITLTANQKAIYEFHVNNENDIYMTVLGDDFKVPSTGMVFEYNVDTDGGEIDIPFYSETTDKFYVSFPETADAIYFSFNTFFKRKEYLYYIIEKNNYPYLHRTIDGKNWEKIKIEIPNCAKIFDGYYFEEYDITYISVRDKDGSTIGKYWTKDFITYNLLYSGEVLTSTYTKYGNYYYSSRGRSSVYTVERTSDGINWQVVYTAAHPLICVEVFDSNIYASTSSGGRIFKSATGNPGDWVTSAILGSPHNYIIIKTYKTHLYAFSVHGGFRSSDGVGFSSIFTPTDAISSLALEVHTETPSDTSYLYIAAHSPTATTGLYRSSNGSTWSQQNDTSLGVPIKGNRIFSFKNMLFLVGSVTTRVVRKGMTAKINWGDGITEYYYPNTSSENNVIPHTYVKSGNYRVEVQGDFFSIKYSLSSHKNKLTKIISFGDYNKISGIRDINFNSCVNLNEIYNTPIRFFINELNNILGVGSLYNCFKSCTSLLTLPSDIFKESTQISSFSSTFDSSGLITVPSDLFRYNVIVESFDGTFQNCTSLQNIPSDLFRYNVNAEFFDGTFQNCTSLENIPLDLFRYNVIVEFFRSTFNGCISLTTIPINLFKYNINATNFSSLFIDCIKLQLNAEIFCSIGEEATRFLDINANFTNTFNRSSFVGVQGIAPNLWSYDFGAGAATKTGCFGGLGNSLISISNYNDIPVDWK